MRTATVHGDPPTSNRTSRSSPSDAGPAAGRRRAGSRRAAGAARSPRPAPASAATDRPRRWSRSSWPAEVAAGDGDRRSRRRAGRSRARAGSTSTLPANRSPPMCETSQVSSGCAAASAAATGRPRSAQHASCRPWVHTAKSGSSCRLQPGRPAGAQRGQVEVEDVLGSVEDGGLEPTAPRGRRARRRPGARSRARRPVPPDRAGAGPGARPARRRQRRCSTVGGEPAVAAGRRRPTGRGSRRAGRRAPSTRCRRARPPRRPPSAAQRNRGVLTPTTSSRPSRTRRRQSTSRLSASRSVGEVRRRQRGGGPDLLERGPQPGRARRGAGRRAAPGAGRRRRRPARRAGRAPAQQASCRSSSSTASTSRSPPREPGAAAWSRNRSALGRATASASRSPYGVGHAGRAGRAARRPGRSGRRAHPAGRCVVGDLVEQASDGARDQAAPGELVDAEGHVERGGVLGAGGVGRAGRQVHRRAPGSSSTSSTRAARVWTSHCLGPWVWKTKTSWLSECTAKPCAPGGVR